MSIALKGSDSQVGLCSEEDIPCSRVKLPMSQIMQLEESALDCCSQVLQEATLVACVCELRPSAIHVSLYGLLTLVYEDFFPQPLIDVKSVLEHSRLALRPEDPGSKFPKTNLAAVDDDARDFTLDELIQLRGLCEKYSMRFQVGARTRVPVTRLSMVQYNCRCLERMRERRDFPLLAQDTSRSHNVNKLILPEQEGIFTVSIDQSGNALHGMSLSSDVTTGVLTVSKVADGLVNNWNAAHPSQSIRPGCKIVSINGKRDVGEMLDELKEKVLLDIGVKEEPLARILAGWNQDLPAYLPLVNNYDKRIRSYRCDATGLTLVAFLDSRELLCALADFKLAVDDAFPGRYQWFDPDSLHCTVRALDILKSRI